MSVYKYAAFISYSHSGDRAVAQALQRMLERFGLTLPFRRRMRVFRDESNLSAHPDLWGTIQSALDQSDAFLLLASPASARSSWVQRELDHFLDHSDTTRLCIVLTDGWTPWAKDGAASREEGQRAISTELEKVLESRGWVPNVVDVRPFVGTGRRMLVRDPELFVRVASAASLVLRQDKDEIFGEHLSAQRRWKAIVLTAAALLLAATLSAVTAAVAALRGRGGGPRSSPASCTVEPSELHFHLGAWVKVARGKL